MVPRGSEYLRESSVVKSTPIVFGHLYRIADGPGEETVSGGLSLATFPVGLASPYMNYITRGLDSCQALSQKYFPLTQV